MPATSTRRTPEQRIADLRAEIERIKTREAQRMVTNDSSLRHISAAVHALDKATAATQDKATREALNEARATLAACLALNGVKLGGGGGGVRRKSGGGGPDAEKVLAFVGKHPGSRGEEIAAELGTDTDTLRPVLHRLRDDGKIKVQGKARATSYSTK
jgi:DNA-binding transcriptional regulator PaaX